MKHRPITSRRNFLRTGTMAGTGLLLTQTPSHALNLSTRYTTVIIDPGHGGSDNGALWGGVKEKDLTLATAKYLEEHLSSMGIRTRMTRRTDVRVSIEERAKTANRFQNAVFISLHFNASRTTSITGIETYFFSAHGRRFASHVQQALANRIRTRNRGIKRGNFKILLETKPPAILTELGFISNPWERERSRQPWLQSILGETLAKGIVAYLRTGG